MKVYNCVRKHKMGLVQLFPLNLHSHGIKAAYPSLISHTVSVDVKYHVYLPMKGSARLMAVSYTHLTLPTKTLV